MNRSRLSIFLFALFLFAATTPGAKAASDEEVALTIYSSAGPGAIIPDMYRPTPGSYNPYQNWKIPGYAMVKSERAARLNGPLTRLRFTDVAAYIDPTTVTFSSITDPATTSVLEQNFQFDLVNQNKLMERYIDREITVEQTAGEKVTRTTGQLLSYAGGVATLKIADGSLRLIRSYTNVLLPDLPSGLITRPTLMWDIATKKPGKHNVRVSYQTEGITWWADYNATYADGADANNGFLDLSAWVSVINKSGASYNDAKLKLVAGEVHRATRPGRRDGMMVAEKAYAPMAADRDGFTEKSFFEYHLYTLGRPTTLPDNSTKQIELFPAVRKVPVKKVMIFDGAPHTRGQSNRLVTHDHTGAPVTSVDVFLRFKNEKKLGMGMPLPAGRVRVSKLDRADDSLELIGEDAIGHTPKDEEVTIKLGRAFDVVGERTRTNFEVRSSSHWMTESFEIKIRNHKKEAVKVIVAERLYRWTNWKVTETNHKFVKKSAQAIHFPVTVKPDGEAVINYTVHYSW